MLFSSFDIFHSSGPWAGPVYKLYSSVRVCECPSVCPLLPGARKRSISNLKITQFILSFVFSFNFYLMITHLLSSCIVYSYFYYLYGYKRRKNTFAP